MKGSISAENITTNNPAYCICSRCIMDTTALGIKFDEKGECNFCKLHDKLDRRYPLNSSGEKAFGKIVHTIKKSRKKSKYDCIIGVSGGRDSTYLLYLAKNVWHLNPLAVHFDDGFDNPIAGENIKKSIGKLGVDLRTITSDRNESRDIRLAFLKASVPNLEVGTDMGIFATLYGAAAKENCRYIFTAHSFRTEGIAPLTWSYFDARYLSSIMTKFGKYSLKKWNKYNPGYNLNFKGLLYYILARKINAITPLYYVNYVRKDVELLIIDKLGWVNTGAHYFDDLWQSLVSYVYRVKFNVDKRRFNYSALIRSGQMTRNEALKRVSEVYVIEDAKTISLCIERLGISKEELDVLMSYEPKTFLDYPTYYNMIKKLRPFIRIASSMSIIPAGTYDKLFNCI